MSLQTFIEEKTSVQKQINEQSINNLDRYVEIIHQYATENKTINFRYSSPEIMENMQPASSVPVKPVLTAG